MNLDFSVLFGYSGADFVFRRRGKVAIFEFQFYLIRRFEEDESAAKSDIDVLFLIEYVCLELISLFFEPIYSYLVKGGLGFGFVDCF